MKKMIFAFTLLFIFGLTGCTMGPSSSDETAMSENEKIEGGQRLSPTVPTAPSAPVASSVPIPTVSPVVADSLSPTSAPPSMAPSSTLVPSFISRGETQEAVLESYLNLVRAALARGEGPDPAVNTVDMETLWVDGIYQVEENNFTYVYAEGTAGGYPTYWTFDLVREPQDGTWRIDRWYASLTDEEFFDSPLGFPLGPQLPWDFSPLGELLSDGTDFFRYRGVEIKFYAPDGVPDNLEEICDLSEYYYSVQLIGFSLTGPEYPTARGICVGDNAEALLAAYPSSDGNIGQTYEYRPPFSEWIGEMVFTLDRGGIITNIEYCYGIN